MNEETPGRTVGDMLMCGATATMVVVCIALMVGCLVSAPGWAKLSALVFVAFGAMFAAFTTALWNDEIIVTCKLVECFKNVKQASYFAAGMRLLPTFSTAI